MPNVHGSVTKALVEADCLHAENTAQMMDVTRMVLALTAQDVGGNNDGR